MVNLTGELTKIINSITKAVTGVYKTLVKEVTKIVGKKYASLVILGIIAVIILAVLFVANPSGTPYEPPQQTENPALLVGNWWYQKNSNAGRYMNLSSGGTGRYSNYGEHTIFDRNIYWEGFTNGLFTFGDTTAMVESFYYHFINQNTLQMDNKLWSRQ